MQITGDARVRNIFVPLNVGKITTYLDLSACITSLNSFRKLFAITSNHLIDID